MAQKIVSYNVAKALKEAGYPQELPCALTRPTYNGAWLWLWDIKNIRIQVLDKFYFAKAKVRGKEFIETNPEEAIAKAIDYLVENNLIK